MNIIGTNINRLDGYRKVSGNAVYGNDIKLPGMLYAACRYSDIVCGKIIALDISPAQNLPGVQAIATFKDIPGNPRTGPIRDDYLPIIDDEVFFHGDVIAVIAADSPQSAQIAADAIKIKYSPYEPITDPLQALKPKARLIHPEYKSNIVNHYPLRKGNLKIGFQVAEQILTRTFTTGFQEHAYIETESVTVESDPDTEGYIIHGSIQNPYTTRKVVASFMGLPLNRINVIPSTLGGSFGGKDDVINNIACRTTLLCKITGKPVQMTYSRENSLRESYKRHPYIMNYKVGFTHEGMITAMKIDIIADSGAYSSQSFFVTWRSLVQAAGPYQIPHVETDIKAVYTNNSYTAAFRGFGSPQIIFAQESLMDDIAAHCGISPRQVRLNNAFQQDSQTASGQILSGHTVSLQQVIETACTKANFLEKSKQFISENAQSERFKKGIGMACSYRGCSLGAEGTDASSAILSVQADGSLIIITGVTENGQGLSTTMSLIACEALGLPMENIVFLSPQTSIIADGGPTVASRGTLAGGNAVLSATQKIKDTIFELIKTDLKVDNINDTLWQNSKIINTKLKRNPPAVSFSEAVAKAFKLGVNLSAYGWFKAPEVSWHEENGQGDAYFTYVYGCQIAEITLDSYTGKIKVDRVFAAHDLGRTINPLGAHGQIYGGIVQGLGYACLENFNINNGKVLSDNFDTYLIPTIADIPEIIPILIENPDNSGPFGAKSLGEPAFELIAAAINNALFHAVAKNSSSLPLSLEQVFLNHDLKKTLRQSIINQEFISTTNHSPVSAEYFSISSLSKALELLENEKPLILAGGTDLIIRLKRSQKKHRIMNIMPIAELKNITENNGAWHIGSNCTFKDIISHPAVIKHFPLLRKACSLIGSQQIRNTATIGGNIVNAAPCADSIPPLIFYDATITLKSANSLRTIPLSEFIISPYKTQILPQELLTQISLPLPKKELFPCYYYQLGRRAALNITRLTLCMSIEFDFQNRIESCRIVAGSLLEKTARITELEEIITDRWIDKKIYRDLRLRAAPVLQKLIGNRWSAEYKIPVFINLMVAALTDLKIQYSENVK